MNTPAKRPVKSPVKGIAADFLRRMGAGLYDGNLGGQTISLHHGSRLPGDMVTVPGIPHGENDGFGYLFTGPAGHF